MLNKEKYVNEIVELALRGTLAVSKGKLVNCEGLACTDCDLRREDGRCDAALIEWANSECEGASDVK